MSQCIGWNAVVDFVQAFKDAGVVDEGAIDVDDHYYAKGFGSE